MKKTLIILLLAIFLMPAAVTGENGSSKKGQGKKALFNGKNLDGWYIYLKDKGKNNDPNQVFTVSNGMIRISGEEFGCITTDEEFENYRLTVKFKWGSKTWAPRIDRARDSGILLHSVGEDGGSDGTWMYSIECQMIEGGTGDIIVVGDGSKDFSVTVPASPEKQGSSPVFMPGGDLVTVNAGRVNWQYRDPEWKDVLGFRGKHDVEKPVGKWNTIVCEVKGDNLMIYLNGKLVNQAKGVKPSKGKIQIQSEGAELFVKEVTVRQL